MEENARIIPKDSGTADAGTVLLSCYLLHILSMVALLIPVSLDSCQMETDELFRTVRIALSRRSLFHPPISCTFLQAQISQTLWIAS